MNRILLLPTLALMFQVQVLPPPPPPPPPPPGLAPDLVINGGGIFAGPSQAPPPIAQTGEAVIEGTVKRPDTQEPIPDVQVTLTMTVSAPTPTPPAQLNTTTDASGKFSFRQIPNGRYSVRATRENYFPPNATSPIASALALVNVDPAQKLAPVVIELVPGGTISGLIRDDKGQPIANSRVAALRSAYRDGRRALQAGKTVQSDDRGNYRLWGLPPGDYYVRAALNTAQAGPLGAGGGTYYPGELDFDRATSVRVPPSGEVAADIRLAPVQQFKISGTFTNTIPELASDPTGFVLMPHDLKIDDGSAGNLIPSQVRAPGSTTFEIIAPRPGVYDLLPVAGMKRDLSMPVPASSITSGAPQFYTGRTTVEVRDRDLEGVKVTITRGVDVSFHANRGAAPASAVQALRVGLRPLDSISTPLTMHLQGLKAFSAEGDLQLASVPAGRYAITTIGVPPGVYIADIRQSARSIYDQNVLTIGTETVEPIEITLGTGGGKVEGTVEGAEKIVNLQISLVPQGSRRGNPLFYRRTPAREGRFTFADIPPGEYRAYAWAELPANADENEDFMKPYEQQGRTVTVTTSGSVTGVSLQVLRK